MKWEVLVIALMLTVLALTFVYQSRTYGRLSARMARQRSDTVLGRKLIDHYVAVRDQKIALAVTFGYFAVNVGSGLFLCPLELPIWARYVLYGVTMIAVIRATYRTRELDRASELDEEHHEPDAYGVP